MARVGPQRHRKQTNELELKFGGKSKVEIFALVASYTGFINS